MGDAVKTVEKEKKPSFFKGVKAEFKKIIWPDKESTFKQSVAVLIATVGLGVIIALLDELIKIVVKFFVNF